MAHPWKLLGRAVLCVLAVPATTEVLQAQDIGALGEVQPVTFNAGLRAQIGFYQVQGIDPRRTPFYWTLSGTPTLTLQGVQLPFMVMVSDQHREFQQPFNQFGLSPYYKWVKVHLGYRDVHFSRFTLAGHRALLAGVELNPGKFRFGFVYGRFRKAVEEDTTATSDPQDYIGAVPVPSYERRGYAIKLGVGKDDHHFDLVMLRASDDPASIPDPVRTSLAPAENLVVGIEAKVKLSESLRWEVDAAGSAYTRDTRSPEGDLDPTVADLLRNVYTPRYSTSGLVAFDTGLSLKRRRARYKLNYRQVDPGYESMGAYFFQNDLRQVTASLGTALFKNKVNLNLTGGWQRNNIKDLRTSTAQRTIGNATVNYASGKAFGMLVTVSNFGIAQRAARANVQDTALLRQVSRNILVQPRLHYARANGAHTFNLTVNHFALNDLSAGVTNSAQLTGIHLELLYTRGWKQHGASLGGGPLHRSTEILVGSTASTGVQVNVGRQWLKDKLSTRLRGSHLWNALPTGGNGTNWQVGLEADWVLSKRFGISLQALHQVNSSDDPVIPSFTEDTGLLGLDIRF